MGSNSSAAWTVPEQGEGSMMGYGWAGWGGGFWMLGGLLLMIGVIVLVVWAVSTVSRTGRTRTPDSSRPTPNGEISEQEFEQARKVLGPDR
jgi:uncharacterized membrane protein